MLGFTMPDQSAAWQSSVKLPLKIKSSPGAETNDVITGGCERVYKNCTISILGHSSCVGLQLDNISATSGGHGSLKAIKGKLISW